MTGGAPALRLTLMTYGTDFPLCGFLLTRCGAAERGGGLIVPLSPRQNKRTNVL